ncbi:hypothetical protein JCM18901_2174 [Psychrobacter sp. JCM 18901]|nr:hypothetical protein JCM18901_2174 [Psychrobacter sp. JCM 18901]
MFKDIWNNFFPKTSKYEVESKLVDVFDTDLQMVITAYFKFDTKNLGDLTEEEKNLFIYPTVFVFYKRIWVSDKLDKRSKTEDNQ